ncbi:VCBS repeat-containing protein [Actinoplanes sp. NPDC051346]|uniref:FG-GAP repeat domain-containing protein n=1 Tax=Actinoplanes sp. NPDC051346 TaxID=3155048 RepID=UPI0034417DA3
MALLGIPGDEAERTTATAAGPHAMVGAAFALHAVQESGQAARESGQAVRQSGQAVRESGQAVRVAGLTSQAAGCIKGSFSDFNGDGVEDVAIADPEATVDGKPQAGQIHIAYGDGATQLVNEGNSQIGDPVEAGDRFGFSVSAYDANDDGCTDLAVGVPYEDIGALPDAGMTFLLFGAPSGLARGSASLTYHQDVGSTPETGEAYDYLGYSVSGARTPAGQSYLVVGVPGEDVGAGIDAGVVHYYRGTLNLLLQSGTSFPGSSENDDQYGYAVAASTHHFAVGAPGEALGALEFAGTVNVFSSSELVSGLPKLWVNINQDVGNIYDAAEANDTFGKSVAVAPYRPAGAPAGQADSLVVVGVPSEDTTAADNGLVQRFHVTAAATISELPAIAGTPADGRYLGEDVALVNIAPTAEGSATTMFLAVGAPGEDLDDVLDAGRVRVYPALSNPLSAPVPIERGGPSLPGEPRERELVGTSLTAGTTRLWVGTPYGDAAVHGFPWARLAAGTATPAITVKPGEGGIPAGAAAFGAAIG